MITAPDLCAVTDAELAEEMQHIHITQSVTLGVVIVSTGIRCADPDGPVQAVTVIQNADGTGVHLIALTGAGSS